MQWAESDAPWSSTSLQFGRAMEGEICVGEECGEARTSRIGVAFELAELAEVLAECGRAQGGPALVASA